MSSPVPRTDRSDVPSLQIDLRFEVDTPDGEYAEGIVQSDGKMILVQSPDLSVLGGGRSNDDLTAMASMLADRGLIVTVADEDGAVMCLGAVRSRFWHRVATRSKFVQVVRWRAAAALKAVVVASRSQGVGMPPPTPVPRHLPIAPWTRRRVTTTHDPYGGGHPRLYLSDTRVSAMARQVLFFSLLPGETIIGSGDAVDLYLDGVDPLQASVERTDDDEYELVTRGTTIHTYVSGRELPRQQLRTGARVEIGPWRLTYVRDEHADHGRPFGGRIGGELGRQRSQTPPAYES